MTTNSEHTPEPAAAETIPIPEAQESEFLNNFRALCPAHKNVVMTAVLVAVVIEDAIRRESR